jgi:circadian clock protein KaiC
LAEKAGNDAQVGIEGLDNVLVGGLDRGRTFLLEGSPGTGKTTIALQFLLAGAAAGERCLYVTLSETEDELRATAAAHGWKLEGVEIFELIPPENLLDEDQQQSLDFRGVRASETGPRGSGQPVGDSPPGAVISSLPPPDPCAEALFRPERRDGADAGRPHDRCERQDRALGRPWGFAPRGRSLRPNMARSAGACV